MKVLFIAVALFGPLTPSGSVIVTRGNVHHRAIAITFDAGADRGYAPRILSILERNRVTSTFGMTGRWARANPDLVRRMARDGDTFINHTYDHRSFTGLSSRTSALSPAQRRWEINQTESVMWTIAHRSTKPYFRPPFGDYDSATVPLIRRLGYRYMIMWSVDSLGWQHLPASAILSRCLRAALPGAIILMHVGIQSQDARALQPLITALKRRHYRIVTIPQLLK